MTPGTIKIADHDGVYVIKMEGDVRLTLCLSFDEFIEGILTQDNYSSVIFDLTHAQAIDSTTLGLMAKISIKASQHAHDLPLVVTDNPSITRILVSMGFDDIFRLVEKAVFVISDDTAETLLICEKNGNETEVQKKVLEAHRLLMGLNEQNKETFKELVETLEAKK
ncbi:Anti-sigma-F factor antagonist RsfB [Thalassocella blandensis]|nr:Anti-sigma-F factor antagonist RsfB [Thalassocella blandensis]